MELSNFLKRLEGVRKSGNGYMALCPAHDDHEPSLSITQAEDRILINCFAGCNAQDVVKSLGLEMKDLLCDAAVRQPAQRRGCTLAAYAAERKLDSKLLREWGVRQDKYFGNPCLLIEYRDEHGSHIRTRRRKELHKTQDGPDTRFDWCKGDRLPLYGLWRLKDFAPQGYVLLVEGESDCHACWHCGIPAVGVPGADTWKPEFAAKLEGRQVYVWHEGDKGGRRLVGLVASDLASAMVIRRPDGFKDLSEAHAKGINIARWLQAELAKALPIATVVEADVNQAEKESLETVMLTDRLEDLAPWVAELLTHPLRRETKETIARTLVEWMLRNQRLIVDRTQDGAKRGRPHMADDDCSIWPIERNSRPIEILLFRAGLNPAETVYQHVLKALELRAVTDGKEVSLCSWQTEREGRLYVSCGPTHVVRVFDGQIEKLPNGTDDVWFSGNSAYPEWSPTDPMSPGELAAFRPALIAPPEVPLYMPEVQCELIDVWLVTLLSGLRPTPVAAAIGQKGGGKTQLGRACVRLLLGPGGDVTSIPTDKRDYAAMTINQPIVVFDNADTDIPSWFADELAGTATGKQIQSRELYTNGNLVTRQQTAAVYISTRTAAFCRPDIAERLLPILTTEFKDNHRIADGDLLAEIDRCRDAVLSWCTQTAWTLLSIRHQAPSGLPLRFVDFASMVWAYAKQQECPEKAPGYLQALRQAQAMAVGDSDPLVAAIPACFSEIRTWEHSWSGSASELVRALTDAGADLPYLGGGKAIARRLREARSTLALMGITLDERHSGNGTVFTLRQNLDERRNGENGESTERRNMRPPSDDSRRLEMIGRNSDIPVSPRLPFAPGRGIESEGEAEEIPF